MPNSPFVVMDKKGRKRRFDPHYRRPDGTYGYTEAELKDLYKEHLDSFTVIGMEVVETASAGPGQLRTADTDATS